MDAFLRSALRCPACLGQLDDAEAPPSSAKIQAGGVDGVPERRLGVAAERAEAWLVCPACRLAYPIREEIPVMLADEAIAW